MKLAELLDPEHYRSTKGRYRLIDTRSFEILDLKCSVWSQKNGKPVGCVYKAPNETEIYKVSALMEINREKAKKIYLGYADTIFLHGNYRKTKPWLADFKRFVDLYCSLKESGYREDCLVQVVPKDGDVIVTDGQHRVSIIYDLFGNIEIKVVYAEII
jgi:hypothetical protein